MTSVIPPAPFFTEADGSPLDDGYIYIGSVGLDARTNPITAYRDVALTIPWAQPIRTSGGYPAYQGAAAEIFVSATACSMTVLDKFQRVNFANLALDLPSSASFITDLAASTGAGLVGFAKPSRVTSTMATVQQGLSPLIDGEIDYLPALGGTDDAVKLLISGTLGSFSMGGTDAAPMNDEKGFWDEITDILGRSPNVSQDLPVYAAGFGRNGMPFAEYSTVLGGHDNITFGVASVAGGAGSATGDPADPIGGKALFLGYCSIAVGKNALAKGQSSAAFGDNPTAATRASVAAGYYPIAKASLVGDPGGEASDGIGAVALGYSAVAAGDGAAALGRDVQAYSGSIMIGSGINPGSPLQNANARSIGLGSNSVKAALEVMPGTGSVSSYGYVQTRGDFRFLADAPAADSTAFQLLPVLTNGGGGASYELAMRPRSAGAVIPGFAVNARSGEAVFEPESDNASDIGSPGLRPKQYYGVNTAISTSDARLKTDVSFFGEQEIAAAQALAAEIGWFQWLDAVASKGSAARRHVGMTVQRAIEIMAFHGLDPVAWGFICHDHWNEVTFEHPAERKEVVTGLLDEYGNSIVRVEEVPAWTEVLRQAGDVYSFRESQLYAFIAAGFEHRLASLEAKAG